MGVGKRRLVLLSVVVVLAVVMVSLPTVDAAPVEYIAEAFTDSSGDWGSESNAYDGNWGTYADNVIFANGDDYPSAYASGFDSGASGSGTITQVDIIVRMSFTSSSASDEWGITLDVGASTGNVLWAMDATAYSLNNNTFTDVTEPNGGGWSWAEIQAAEIHLDSNKVGGKDNDVWNVYEFALKITTTPSGNDYTAYPDGDLTLTGETSLIADFVKALVEGFTLTGETSLIAGFVKALVEGFTLAGTTSIFVIIQKIIAEGFGLTGGTSLAVSYSVLLAAGFVLAGAASLASNYSVRLGVGFSLGGAVAVAASYVKNLVEGFSLADTVSAFKVFIVELIDDFTVGVESNIEKIAGTVLIGSMFYQLFFSLNMWGYLGPIALVVIGYLLTKKEKNLGIFVIIVESLVIAQYLALIEATPDYWWNVIILLLGVLLTIGQWTSDR